MNKFLFIKKLQIILKEEIDNNVVFVFTVLSCKSQKSTQQPNPNEIENELVPKFIIDAEPNTVNDILYRLNHYNDNVVM